MADEAALVAKLAVLAQRFDALEDRFGDPALAGSPEYAAVVREHGRLARIVAPYRELVGVLDGVEQARELIDDDEMGELAREEVADGEARSATLIEDIKGLIVQGDALSDRPALVEVRAGTGGDEASLFAGDLVRMYQLHCQRRGWACELIEASEGEQGGFKEAILGVRGEGAYGLLRYESGGHRVQRVPATESQGRVHTSAATVAVMPEAEAVDVDIREDDLDIERKRAGGAGGQHVNKTESAIRITHRPSGIVVSCQDEKSQIANLDKAMKVLRARVYDLELQKAAAARAAERKGQVGTGDRSDRIRTYNFPQNRITDHRINRTSYDLDHYLQGHLEDLQTAMIDEAKVRVLADWDPQS
jgi:peptide chain release factor 1